MLKSTFLKVFLCDDLREYILSFTNGIKYKTCTNGNFVCKKQMLRLMKEKYKEEKYTNKCTLKYTDKSIKYICINGNLKIFKWLYKNKYEETYKKISNIEDYIYLIIKHKHFDVLKYVCDKKNGPEWILPRISLNSALLVHDNLQIVDWLYQKRYKFFISYGFIKNIILINNLESLKWIYRKYVYIFDKNMIDFLKFNAHSYRKNEIYNWLNNECIPLMIDYDDNNNDEDNQIFENEEENEEMFGYGGEENEY